MKQLKAIWNWCRRDWLAGLGAAGIVFLLLLALLAPFLANGRPWLWHSPEGWISPALRTFFAPDSSEFLIEQAFNYLLLLLPGWLLLRLVLRRFRKIAIIVFALLLLLPFMLVQPQLDKTDYRREVKQTGTYALFTPIPYGPFEAVTTPFASPSRRHWCGADEIGRDLTSRLIYGARVSLAVGLGATLIALIIGTAVGLLAGYRRGWFDLITMRLVEVIMCFPTFLLLLIIMSILRDYKFEQSILIVIGVIGLTGWIGLTFLVRGEVLKGHYPISRAVK